MGPARQAYDPHEKASRDLIIQAEPESLMKASASCLHISYGSVDAESVLFAMTLRGAGEPSRTITVPVGASFSSPELPLELGFPSFALDSNSVGFPLNISFLDFPAEIRLEIYRLLFMNHEHKCVWLDGNGEDSEDGWDSDDDEGGPSIGPPKIGIYTNILATCRQIRAEATPVLFAGVEFGLHMHPTQRSCKRTYAVADRIRFLYMKWSPYRAGPGSSERITGQIQYFPNLQCLSIGLQKDRLHLVKFAESSPFHGRKGDQRLHENRPLAMTIRDAILHRAIRIAAETHLTEITEQPSDHLAKVVHRIRIMIPGAKVPYRNVSVMLHIE
jgi:hypothetical protein